jgi:hypothetical protein
VTPQQFVATWTPAAQDAGAQLGIPWQWVLAQWGLESGYGQSVGTPAAANLAAGNPADLKASGGGWASFSSQPSFVQAYVAAMRADYGQAWSGLSGAPSVGQVLGAPQAAGSSYYGGQSAASYGHAVASSLRQLAAVTGMDVPVQLSAAQTAALAGGALPTTQPPGQWDPYSLLPPSTPNLGTGLRAPAGEGQTVTGSVSGGSPSVPPASPPATGWLGKLEAWVGHGAAVAGTVLLGVALLGLGLFLAARGAGVRMPAVEVSAA